VIAIEPPTDGFAELTLETDDLAGLERFYVEAIGLRVLAREHCHNPVPAPPCPSVRSGAPPTDIGRAGLLGGNLFGRLALHPSVAEISDKAERGKLVNVAWRRYGTINSPSARQTVVETWRRHAANGAKPTSSRRAAAGSRRQSGVRARRHWCACGTRRLVVYASCRRAPR
jgi:hypothetical protein